MKFKIILFLCFYITIQHIHITVLAEEDITQNADYQAVMNKIRNNKLEQQKSSDLSPKNTESVSKSISKSPTQDSFNNTVPVPYYQNLQTLQYNEIILKYNKSSINYNDIYILSDYTDTVENYLKQYGNNSLKSQNINNYFLIIMRLAYAYTKTSRINEAIATYEILLNDLPENLYIKKQLILLYDYTKSCENVQNILKQIKKSDPSFNMNLTNCNLTPKTQNSDIQLYNKIISKYNEISHNSNNIQILTEYINVVEDYIKQYGNNSLKAQNADNYFLIIARLAEAYTKASRTNEAITTLENLQKDFPQKLGIKQKLIFLYDKTKACTKVNTLLEDLKKYNKNYNLKLINCDSTELPTDINHPKDNQYNWGIVYATYIVFWSIIIVLGILFLTNIYISTQTNEYIIKHDTNKSPIKPSTDEFGIKKIQSELDINSVFFLFAPLTMICVSLIYSAPSVIFPLLKNIHNPLILPYGVIFWYISAFALNTLFYYDNIKKYHYYKVAIELYNNKKLEYEYEKEKIKQQRETERRRKEYERRQLLKRKYEYKQRLRKEYWYNLAPYEFEKQIGELFKCLGYHVTITPKSNDCGIDIIIKKGNITKGVQCKKYKNKVGRPDLQRLWGAKDGFRINHKLQNINGVIMVALSGVTSGGYKYIQDIPAYELWTIDTILYNAKKANYNYI